MHRFPYLYKSTACFYKDTAQVIQLTTGKIKICKMYITARVQIIRHRGAAIRFCVLDRLLKCTVALLESLTFELFEGRNLICYSSTFNRVGIQSFFIRAHSKQNFLQ